MNAFENLVKRVKALFTETKSIQAEDLPTEIAAGTALVDVREADETAAGIIPGAICLPLSLLGTRLSTLPKEKKLAVYCRTGMRSRVACRMLNKAGYDAHNLKGGYLNWKRIRPE